MATKARFRKQLKNHVITWSDRQGRYVIKKGKRQIYDTDTLSSAVGWIKRNVK